MRELNNFNEIPEFFPWEPTFNKVVITLKTEAIDDDLVLSDTIMSPIQYVVAVGPSASHYFKVGDKVIIDLKKMIIRERNPENATEHIERIEVDPIEHEDITYGLIEDRFIKAKYKG